MSNDTRSRLMTAETDLLPLVGTLRALPEHVQGVVQAYARANVAHATKALRAEVERLNRILGRIIEGDGDSTLTIRAGTDAFAAAREYLLRDKEEGK